MESNKKNDTESTYRVKTSLISRNITVMGRRTSVRLEPEMWTALQPISQREKCSVNDLCCLVYLRKGAKTSLTAAIRVFLMLYFQAAATEQGHRRAAHGDFEGMRKRAQISSEYDSFFKGSKRLLGINKNIRSA